VAAMIHLRIGLLLLGALAASAPAQVRDARPATPPGTGVIEGVVVEDGVRLNPAGRAHVALTAPELRGGRIIITDQSGRFRFTDLPAGRYTLTSTKPAYLPASYGATRPGGLGTTIGLRDGEQLTDARLTMFRGGVITGRVTDERGGSLPGVSIYVMRNAYVAGTRQLITETTTVTDSTGTYRVFGLKPGQYTIRVTQYFLGSMWPNAPGEIDATLRSGTPPAPQPVRPIGYSSVFYPGTLRQSEAGMVTVGAATEVNDIDVVVRLVPIVAISGRVTSPEGTLKVPADVRVIAGDVLRGARTSSVPGQEGRFEFSGLSPGHYGLTVRSTEPAGWTYTEFDVSGEPLPDFDLHLQPMVSVTGRFVFEGADGDPHPDSWRVRLVASTDTIPSMSGTSENAGSDGSFRISNVSGGQFWVEAVTPNAVDAKGRTWTVRSAVKDGVDHVDAPLDLTPGRDVKDIVVTLTPERTELSGTLKTPAGLPAADFYVIAFATDRALWPRRSPRIRAVRPGNDGQFRIRDLRGGEYYLAAFRDAEEGEWYDPAFLEKLIPAAIKLPLAFGEKKVQDLQIVK